MNNLTLTGGCSHARPVLTGVTAPARFFGLDARKIAKSAQSLFRATNPAKMRVKPRPSRLERAWLHPRNFGGSTPPKLPRFRRNPENSRQKCPILPQCKISQIKKRHGYFRDEFKWSGLRGSNSLPPPWQGGALPDELNPQMVPPVGIEPTTRGFSVPCSTN